LWRGERTSETIACRRVFVVIDPVCCWHR
jgi:hypothetical protein